MVDRKHRSIPMRLPEWPVLLFLSDWLIEGILESRGFSKYPCKEEKTLKRTYDKLESYTRHTVAPTI